jgi:amino acid adenylation domain-containing protein
MATGSGVRSLPDAFRLVAQRYPQNMAVSDGTRSLTYSQLDAESERFAAGLHAYGVRPRDYVGLIIDRSVQTPIAILGTLKAGCAYVPLDPTYPAQWLRYVTNDSRLTTLVSDDIRVLNYMSNVEVIPFDGIYNSKGTRPMGAEVELDSPAYVIYTSGSTGEPKGCVISHRNVLSLMQNTLPLFDFRSTDRWTVFHSFSFDFSVWELWGALLTGAAALCVSDEALAAEDLLELLLQERVTVLSQVPSAFRAFARIYAASAGPALDLRYVFFGGESVDMDVIQSFRTLAAAKAPAIVNMYGITEATVHCTIKFITDADYDSEMKSPIGRPLPHVAISIRDDQMRPVPFGEVGEMYVGGDGVALGYLNRPKLTAERFPTLDTAQGPRRFYRTGDLARETPLGLNYVGRNDEQVKIRGYRIELGEIEVALRTHDVVSDAAVVPARRASGYGQHLIACVVTQRPVTQRVLAARLREHLLALLPRYMAPSQYLIMPELPLTPSGKLDRRRLQLLVNSTNASDR